MELKIKVHCKPRIEFDVGGVNGHVVTKNERDYYIKEFEKRNIDKFECDITDYVDLNTCKDLLVQAFGNDTVDLDNVELLQFTHKFEDLTVDWELTIKFEALCELTLHEDRFLDYIHDWIYSEGAHIWLVNGWFGENDIECYYTIYTDESNTDVSIEWKKN